MDYEREHAARVEAHRLRIQAELFKRKDRIRVEQQQVQRIVAPYQERPNPEVSARIAERQARWLMKMEQLRLKRRAKMAIGSLVVSLVFGAIAWGQAIVKPDSIASTDSGHSPVPRFATIGAYTNNHVVPAGVIETLPATFDFDAIEVSGTLRLSRTFDTSGRFIVIQVLPGGSLDFGTETDPVLRRVSLVCKDIPLLTGTDGALGPDPEQFGNGIHVFGEWKSYGRKLNKTWTTFAPVAAGATQITLTDAVNWQVGDSLLIPDTRQTAYYPPVNFPTTRVQRRESIVTIGAINGNTITLSKPLDFEHSDIRDSKANLLTLPFVANTTRNIVIQSENPSGVRGHCMFMDRAHVTTYYTAFIGLGRTLPKTIDSFNSHTQHVGLNQIARYARHWHHVMGHVDDSGYTGVSVGDYLDGTDVNKWGSVQHGTHDLLITDNVAERFVGACFTSAEDGYEVRGKYLRNFAAYCNGNGQNGKNNVIQPTNAPGAEGAGIWGHGSGSTFSGNVSACCASGFSFVHMNQVQGHKIPSIPGGEDDSDYDVTQSVPLSFDNNLAVACNQGFEGWRIPNGWVVQSCKLLNSGNYGYDSGSGERGYVILKDCQIVNTFLEYLNTRGISSSQAYTTALDFTNTTVEGFVRGQTDARELMVFRNCRWKNRDYNIDIGEQPHLYNGFTIDSPTFERIEQTSVGPVTTPIVHIRLGDGSTDPNPPVGVDFSKLWTVTNWGGKNYQLYENYAAPASAVALDGLVNAKAVQQGVVTPPVNNPPVVSQIVANPPDVDPATPGVQEYELSSVTYSATATDADGDALTWTASYSGAQVASGSGGTASWTFPYPAGPKTYPWVIEFTDSRGAKTIATLTVQVIAKPVTPPTDQPPPSITILWRDGKNYTYQLVQ